MKNRFLQTAVAVAILVGVFGAGVYVYSRVRAPLPEVATIANGVQTFGELVERFVALAKDKGAIYAFDVLRVAKLPPDTDTHMLGHAVGDVLYQQEGVAGMAHCTQDFRNACSHSMVIGAMAEYGDAGALPLIQDACRKAPGGVGAYTMCYHGLGHGVFAYFGYDLPKTVSYCKKFGTDTYGMREYIECVGGAGMELVGGGGHSRALWTLAREKYLTRDPLSPCTNNIVPDIAKPICLMYLTPELVARAGGSASSLESKYFAKAMSYCDAIPKSKKDMRDSCYGGFGKEFVPFANDGDIRSIDRMTDAQYAVAITWCNYATPVDGRESCIRSELGSVVWGGETNPDTWFRFCGLLSGTLQSACYTELGEEIDSYVRDERNPILCKRLPEEYAQVCLGESPELGTAAVLLSGPDSQGSLEEEDTYWQSRIKTVGGQAAYTEFARAIQNDTTNKQHTMAHVFGSALYKTSGTRALGVCDARFSYGCFHQFLAKAIQEHGLREVAVLNQGCQQAGVANPLSCQHGIGHGVVAYIGYDRSSLDKALGICKDLPFIDPVGGCYSGAFMEYNLHTMLGESADLRPVVEGNIFAPCDTLGESYQQACAFWQPQWWFQAIYQSDTSPEVYTKLGAHCDAMESDQSIRRSCYEGIGTIAPGSVENVPEKAAALCDATSTSPLYRLYCRSYAASALAAVTSIRIAQKVCDGLTGASAEYCNAHATNQSDIPVLKVPL